MLTTAIPSATSHAGATAQNSAPSQVLSPDEVSSASQASSQPHLVALLTCYNRQHKTHALLASLKRQQPFAARLSIVLVDDGSSDGTSEMVQRCFPEVVLVQGTGQLYWCGGMRLAQRCAVDRFGQGIDYLLWLNDDVVLDDDALQRLLQQAQTCKQQTALGALVGAVRHPDSAKLSYGGRRRGPWWAPLKFSAVLPPREELQRCDFINGNVCLLPFAALSQLGGLSPDFTHSMGDYDVGLRLQQHGFELFQAPGSFGSCAGRPVQGSIADRTLPIKTRLAMLHKPNHAAPVAQWQLFLRRHGGPFSMLGRAKAQLRHWFPTWYLCFIAKAPERQRVVVVQQVVRQYRLAFWQALHQQLAAQNIDLIVLYGEPDQTEHLKNDAMQSPIAPWFIKAPVRQLGAWCWQYHSVLATADVVVCEHAIRHLLPFYLKLRGIKLVWWGHGYDHHANTGKLSSALKAWWRRQLLGLGQHYLAYTQPVADYLETTGIPSSRISVVNNSQDCSEVQHACATRQAPLGPLKVLYCGSLYREKRLDLLIAAVEAAVAQGVVQQLVIVGDGPLYAELAKLSHPWLLLRGAMFGADKAHAYAEADVVLNPGLTGLALLDAFAAGLPYITCSDSLHSPEFAYLKHGKNGLVVAGQVAALLDALRLVAQPDVWLALCAQARRTAAQLPLSQMVTSYANGLMHALGLVTYDVCLVHQAYRQRGGEDVVVERDYQWLTEQGLSVCLHRTRYSSSWSGPLAFITRLVRPQSVTQLPNARSYWLHNTQGSFGQQAARAIKHQRHALVLQTLHNMRPLWPGGVFRPGQWHTADLSSVSAAWHEKPWRDSRVGSALLALQNYRQRHWHHAVDVLVCPSKFVQREYLAAGIAATKLRLKPHYSPHPEAEALPLHRLQKALGGCDMLANAPLTEPLPAVARPIRCLYVGRVDEQKGLPWLLEVWPTLQAACDEPLRLEVVTPTPAPDLQQASQQGASIEWLTALDWPALSAHYAKADIVIMPSLVCESFGNVMIEAASHGCIVLASNVGALLDVAGPLGAHLFSAGDPIDFKRQFKMILQQLPVDPDVVLQHRQARISAWAQHYSVQAQPQWPVVLIEQQRR